MIGIQLLDNEMYCDDLHHVSDLPLPWERLAGKTVLIAGATGMIGKFLTDAIMYKNRTTGLSCTVYALGRSERKAADRFWAYQDEAYFRFLCRDVGIPGQRLDCPADYILHLASNTHPLAYAKDPVGTIAANINGTCSLLELAVKQGARFVLASSVEIYGENRGDTGRFNEDYCGYIDCNTLRAGYPESKRSAEALCQAYISQKHVDAVIARLPRTFGPTMLMSDTKALSQFIKNGVAGENIVLKSAGTQLYSYGYVADVVCGLLFCMMKGACGEAYNIADEKYDVTLKKLAELIAGYAGTKVVFALPDAMEAAGYSKATKALMDGAKLQALGWTARYDMTTAIERTVSILKQTQTL